MNCKYCGKRLSESARFCDRCGEPVGRRTTPKSNSSSKKPSTKKPVQKNGDSYDKYRKRKMQQELEAKRRKRKRRLVVVWVILLTLICAIAGGIYAHTYMLQNVLDIETVDILEQGETNNKATEENQEEQAEITPSPSPSASPSPTPTEIAQEDTSGCDIYIDRAYGFKCAYPSRFVTGTLSNNNTRLSLRDGEGDGQVLISYQKISKTDTASSLMKEYVNGLGADPDINRAGDNWYSVTFSRSGRINHRFAVVIPEEQYIYYDFVYEQGTAFKSEYDGYIDYMDKYLQKQVSKKK